MGEAELYQKTTGAAIHAMMDSARKDEYVDKNIPPHFPTNKKKREKEISLKDIREWNKKRAYKEGTGLAIDAMMESASTDPYADLNPPSRF